MRREMVGDIRLEFRRGVDAVGGFIAMFAAALPEANA
jgi:hypothetical protein